MKIDPKVAYLAQHNVDSGAFHTDPMHEALQPHQTPSMGLNSRNVKRNHNGRKAAKAQLGVTGGFVSGGSAASPAQAARNARFGQSKHDRKGRRR